VSDADELLDALGAVDDRLRAVYRALAVDPGLAEAHEAAIRELHARRRELAEQVGLALLAARRASHASAIDSSLDVPPTIALDGESVGGNDSTEAPAASEGPNDVAVPEPMALAISQARDAAVVPDSGPVRDSVPEPPVSSDVLAEWTRSAKDGGVGRADYRDRFSATWENVLEELATHLGAPRELEVDHAEELEALDRVSEPPLVDAWAKLPGAIAQLWLAEIVARARALKDVSGLPAAERTRLSVVMRRFPEWAAEHRPGHVNGLRRDHVSQSESWAGDARDLWAELRARIGESAPKAAAKAKARAKKHGVSSVERDAESNRAIDSGWPLWPRVRGKRALLVGGDPREPNRERLEKLFELASLEWPDVAGPRKVEAVVGRIKKRTVDLVVVLMGFVDHKQSEPIVAAAKDAGVDWALADGYGSAQLRTGLERFLLPRA
jgi:hypothetical protein